MKRTAMMLALGIGFTAATTVSCVKAHAQDPSRQMAAAGDAASHPFSLAGMRVDEKLTRKHMIGRAPMYVTAGTRLFVPAARGLSLEYVTQTIQNDLARADGVLSAPDVRVQVRSAGEGYFVDVTSEQPSRARALHEQLLQTLSAR